MRLNRSVMVTCRKEVNLETWYKDVTFSLVILLVFSPPFIKTGQCAVL